LLVSATTNLDLSSVVAVMCAVTARCHVRWWSFWWPSDSVGCEGSTSSLSYLQPSVHQSTIDWSWYDSFCVTCVAFL